MLLAHSLLERERLVLKTVVGLLIAGTAFILTDCVSGNSVQSVGQTTGQYHVAQWTEISSTIDSDGHVSIRTTIHPEEWHVLAHVADLDHDFDVQVKPAIYFTVTNGQWVNVKARQGRFTKTYYLSEITL